MFTVFFIQMRCRYNFWRWDSQVENLNASWTLIFWQPLHILQGSYLGGSVVQEISVYFAEKILLFPISGLFFSYIPCSLASTVWSLQKFKVKKTWKLEQREEKCFDTSFLDKIHLIGWSIPSAIHIYKFNLIKSELAILQFYTNQGAEDLILFSRPSPRSLFKTGT